MLYFRFFKPDTNLTQIYLQHIPNISQSYLKSHKYDICYSKYILAYVYISVKLKLNDVQMYNPNDISQGDINEDFFFFR